MNKADLKLDWCSYKAAKYAVEHWHYSRRMPIGKIVKIGAWESSAFIGCILFSTGASAQLHKAFRVLRNEVCELVRVALAEHCAPVTRIVAVALNKLRGVCPGLRLVVSFADPERGHVGGIYQAGNWIYVGRSSPGLYYRLPDGSLTHNRNLQGPKVFGGSPAKGIQAQWTAALRADLASGKIKRVVTAPKYKYLMPLDPEMRKQIEPLAKPYPKKCAGSIENDAATAQVAEGGVIPTPALQEK